MIAATPLRHINEGTLDVVAAHQEQNHKPKAPSADHLCWSAAHQGGWPCHVPDSEEEVIPNLELEWDVANDPDDAAQSDGSEEPVKKCTKHNSQHHDAKPTQLQFYPGHWHNVVKEFFCLWMVKECPFPQRDLHLVNAKDALKVSMEEFEENGSIVEDGKSISAESLWLLTTSPEYYPEYIHDMLGKSCKHGCIMWCLMLEWSFLKSPPPIAVCSKLQHVWL